MIFANQIKIATTPPVEIGPQVIPAEKMHILHKEQLFREKIKPD